MKKLFMTITIILCILGSFNTPVVEAKNGETIDFQITDVTPNSVSIEWDRLDSDKGKESYYYAIYVRKDGKYELTNYVRYSAERKIKFGDGKYHSVPLNSSRSDFGENFTYKKRHFTYKEVYYRIWEGEVIENPLENKDRIYQSDYDTLYKDFVRKIMKNNSYFIPRLKYGIKVVAYEDYGPTGEIREQSNGVKYVEYGLNGKIAESKTQYFKMDNWTEGVTYSFGPTFGNSILIEYRKEYPHHGNFFDGRMHYMPIIMDVVREYYYKK